MLDSTARRNAFGDVLKLASSTKHLQSYFKDPDRGHLVRDHLIELARIFGNSRRGYPELGLNSKVMPFIHEETQEPGTYLDVNAVAAVDRVIAGIELLLKWSSLAGKSAKPERHDHAPEFRLIAYMLPEVFERHFDQQFTINTSASGQTGKGFAFVRATLNEASRAGVELVNFSDETIRKYYRDGKMSRLRRSPKQ